MRATRVLLVVLVVLSLVAVPLAGVGLASPAETAEPTDDETTEPEDDPTTEGTVGYVDGYWYDDELPVDERDDATLEDDELEAVVSRSMARVEVIRNLTFQEDVPVEVVSREEFQAENDELFADFDGEETFQNVRYEALFMVDRETDATEAYEALYGDSVAGYYDTAADEIVIVSDSEQSPEIDEVILGHELLHALQDQHFGLERFDGESLDQRSAELGLIEGDAVWVENEYDDRCEVEWDCVLPTDTASDPLEPNWGMFLTVFHPYSDGPAYVDHLLEEGDWEAVNDAYDDPPASSSEVIRPDEEREPVEIVHEDRSSDRWEHLEVENGPDHASFGEVGMASMFAATAFDDRDEVVPEDDDVCGGPSSYNYDIEYTDGWAGDKLVVYAADDEAISETGYVWHTEWTSEEEAEQFLEGYLELLEIHDAEAVDGHQDTVVIEEAFPGAYYVDHDGESVTIVRAPSVDELPEIHDGAAPTGGDTIAFPFAADDSLTGFGVTAAALAIVVIGVIVRRR